MFAFAWANSARALDPGSSEYGSDEARAYADEKAKEGTQLLICPKTKWEDLTIHIPNTNPFHAEKFRENFVSYSYGTIAKRDIRNQIICQENHVLWVKNSSVFPKEILDLPGAAQSTNSRFLLTINRPSAFSGERLFERFKSAGGYTDKNCGHRVFSQLSLAMPDKDSQKSLSKIVNSYLGRNMTTGQLFTDNEGDIETIIYCRKSDVPNPNCSGLMVYMGYDVTVSFDSYLLCNYNDLKEYMISSINNWHVQAQNDRKGTGHDGAK